MRAVVSGCLFFWAAAFTSFTIYMNYWDGFVAALFIDIIVMGVIALWLEQQ